MRADASQTAAPANSRERQHAPALEQTHAVPDHAASDEDQRARGFRRQLEQMSDGALHSAIEEAPIR